jgi:hypothetical protein
MEALRMMMDAQYYGIAQWFYKPVPRTIPGYHAVVTHPMDLSTIKRKLKQGEYADVTAFEMDVRLMFNNCRKFNPVGDPVRRCGDELEAVFDEEWERLKEEMEETEPQRPAKLSPDGHCMRHNCIVMSVVPEITGFVDQMATQYDYFTNLAKVPAVSRKRKDTDPHGSRSVKAVPLEESELDALRHQFATATNTGVKRAIKVIKRMQFNLLEACSIAMT